MGKINIPKIIPTNFLKEITIPEIFLANLAWIAWDLGRLDKIEANPELLFSDEEEPKKKWKIEQYIKEWYSFIT